MMKTTSCDVYLYYILRQNILGALEVEPSDTKWRPRDGGSERDEPRGYTCHQWV